MLSQIIRLIKCLQTPRSSATTTVRPTLLPRFHRCRSGHTRHTAADAAASATAQSRRSFAQLQMSYGVDHAVAWHATLHHGAVRPEFQSQRFHVILEL